MKPAITKKPSILEHTVIGLHDRLTLDTRMAILLSVVVPTRNERENIGPLIQRLEAALSDLPCELIFVDDSDDETPGVIRGLRSSLPVRLIERQGEERRGGLATAVVAGIERARGEYVCVLDADLQHPPEQVVTLLHQALSTGADMVVATRYGAGGHLDGLGGRGRQAASHLCKWLAQALLLDRVRSVSDPLGGFFLVRRALVHGVGLRPIGYRTAMEILARARPSKVVEVPYELSARQAGRSKASLRQGVTFLLHLLRLLREVPQAGRAWKFAFVGGLGALVNLGLLFLLSGTAGLPRGAAWFPAVEASVLHNFVWHQTFTWRDRREAGAGAWLRRATAFHLSVAGTVAINGTLFGLLSIAGAPLILAGLAGIAGSAVFNFVIGDRWVFKPLRAGSDSWEPER